MFLHEGLGSAGLWRDLPAAIARRTGWATLAYSRAGNGFSTPVRSPRRPQYMHDEALIVLPALLERLGIGKVALIGHSDGGSIALLAAAAYPAIVCGVVVEAPHVMVEPQSLGGIAAAKAEYERGGLRGRLARHHAEVDTTFYGWNDVWLSPEFATWNIQAVLSDIAVPILAIQGTADPYGTLAQIDAIERSVRTRVDRLVLAGCGHAPHRERATLVEATIAAWLEP